MTSTICEQNCYQDNLSGHVLEELVRPDPVDQADAAIVDAEQQTPDHLEHHHEVHLAQVLVEREGKESRVSRYPTVTRTEVCCEQTKVSLDISFCLSVCLFISFLLITTVFVCSQPQHLTESLKTILR